jgi:hypothetical protein
MKIYIYKSLDVRCKNDWVLEERLHNQQHRTVITLGVRVSMNNGSNNPFKKSIHARRAVTKSKIGNRQTAFVKYQTQFAPTSAASTTAPAISDPSFSCFAKNFAG